MYKSSMLQKSILHTLSISEKHFFLPAISLFPYKHTLSISEKHFFLAAISIFPYKIMGAILVVLKYSGQFSHAPVIVKIRESWT